MSRKSWMWIATGILVASAARPVLAADHGFYFSAGAGRAEEDPGKSSGINFGIGFPVDGISHIDPSRVEVDGGAVGWDFAVGYKLSRYLSAEVAYMDFGTTDITEFYDLPAQGPIVIDLVPFSYSSTVKGPAISALGSLPLGKGFELFLRAGALFADRKIEISQYPGSQSSTFGDTVWLGGAGVDWSFAKRWAIRAEYERSGNLGSTLFTGETAVDLLSLRLRFSL